MVGFHTGQQIINESLLVFGETDRDKYLEGAMYFARGYRDFKLFNAGAQIKEAYRDVSAVNTVSFPEDLLRLIEIGVLNNGEFFSFTRAETLVDPSDPLDSAFNTDREEGYNINRSPVSGYGAKGTNVEYYYKEDRESRRVILSRIAVDLTRFADRSEVLFRYVSNGISDDLSKTIIASDAANMLTSYIVWKMVEARPKDFPMNYILLKKEDFIEERKKYETLELPSLANMIDVVYETSAQTVRRI